MQDDRPIAELTKAEAAAALVALARRDLELRAELFRSGERAGGYHPQLRALHRENAEALVALVTAHGWPMAEIDGDEAAEAAFFIAQHAIAEPSLMRQMFSLIADNALKGRAPAWQMAHLADRIAVFEGRGQIFGTHFDWNDDGRLSPSPIAEAHDVNARRDSVALPPIEQEIARQRDDAARDGERPPIDLVAYRARQDAFAREAGWRA